MPPNSVEEEYDQVEALLSQAETKQEVRDRLHRLFILTFRGDDPALTARFNALARNAAEGQVALQSGKEVTNKAFQDYAKVLYTKSLIRDERYEETDEFLKQLDTEELLGYDRRDYLHLRMVTEAYHGRYPKALETLREYYAFQKSQGEDMEEVKAINSVIEEDLMARLEAGEGKIRDNERQAEAVSENTELTLNNYPNPFNPTTTTIRFTLPEQSEVSLVVYDMLGREVAQLVDELLPAGEQTVRFDASDLANGIYLYRLQANQHERVRMMTLIK